MEREHATLQGSRPDDSSSTQVSLGWPLARASPAAAAAAAAVSAKRRGRSGVLFAAVLDGVTARLGLTASTSEDAAARQLWCAALVLTLCVWLARVLSFNPSPPT